MLVNEWTKMALVLHWLFSLGLLALSKGPVTNLDVAIESFCKSLVHVLMLFVEDDHSILLVASLVSIISSRSGWAVM